MCLTPVKIRNPNYLADPNKKFNRFKDCSNQFIYVPCGHCPECIGVKQMGLIQRIQMEARNNYIYYSTVTYNNETIPIKELPKFDRATGERIGSYQIKYAKKEDFQQMVKRIRNYNQFGRKFKYFAVQEFGTKKGRPHMHILWIVPKYETDDKYTKYDLEKIIFDVVLREWRRNIGSDRKPVYVPLCTYTKKWIHGKLYTNYDTHYVIPGLTKEGENDVGFYVLKYLMKPSKRAERLQQALKLNLDDDEYESIWNEIRPRYFKSLDFGNSKDPETVKYLRDCISKTKAGSNFPCFINPNSGNTFPLSRFYKSKGEIFGLDDAEYFFRKKNTADSSYYSDCLKSKGEAARRIEKYNKQLQVIDSHDESLDKL